MNEMLQCEFSGVICIHCRKPIPLRPEPPGSEGVAQEFPTVSGPSTESTVFLVWCDECLKEAPYATSEITKCLGANLPQNFRPHPVFTRLKEQSAYRKAANT